MSGRWLPLALYVAAIYALVPVGPRIGLAVARTGAGNWLLGPGVVVATAAGAMALGVRLHRRGAPPWSWAALLGAAVAYLLAFAWLDRQHLERTHLPEYGIAALLAWRAVAPRMRSPLAAYAVAALLAAAVGYGEELLQAVVPWRHYDLRDVAMNAVGAVLGVVLIAVARAGRPRDVQVRAAC